MSKPKKVPVGDGKLIDAESLDFQTKSNPWTVIEAEDGTTLEMKPAIVEILRLKDSYNDMGEPVYIVRSTNVLRTSSIPENLLQRR